MKRSASRFIWGLSVRAIIRDRRGRILLVRRHPASKYFGGTWELPGGKADAGESFDVALPREVREETGLVARLGRVVGASQAEIPGVRIVMLYFETLTRSTRVRLSDEHDDFCWISPTRIKFMEINPQMKTFVEEYFLSQRRPQTRRKTKP